MLFLIVIYSNFCLSVLDWACATIYIVNLQATLERYTSSIFRLHFFIVQKREINPDLYGWQLVSLIKQLFLLLIAI